MTQNYGGGGSRAKDDVTFFNAISGENTKQFDLKVGFIINKSSISS